jgi:hypothetical protein
VVEPVAKSKKFTDTALAVERVMGLLLTSQTIVRLKVPESLTVAQFSYAILT